MDKFYLVLPSNSSMKLYPENTLANFKVSLSQPIMLNDPDKWEVGLAEIQFPNSWYNIVEGKNYFEKDIVNPTREEVSGMFTNEKGNIELLQMITGLDGNQKTEVKSVTPVNLPSSVSSTEGESAEPPKKKAKDWQLISLVYRTRIALPAGRYDSVKDIIDPLNKSQKGIFRPFHFEYDPVTKRTKVDLKKNCAIRWQNSDIARCLGFFPDGVIKKEGKTVSPTLSSVQDTISSIYVYTDIIENQHAGDVKVPLLRIVPVTQSHGKVCYEKYDKPYFFPVNRGHIEKISINIRGDTGELIPFQSGKVVVTLLFKRKLAKFYD